MKQLLRQSIVLLVLLTAITGVAYPLVVTGLGQLLFSSQANGSLIERDGKTVGSVLIGQGFSHPKYFWSRPSATSPFPYNGGASSGSNQGPNNPALTDAIKQRIDALHAADPSNTTLVPVDLITASGSGLDPHISLAAANYQLMRVARVRSLSVDTVQTLIEQATESRQFGLLGEPRVNVLKLNLLLDKHD